MKTTEFSSFTSDTWLSPAMGQMFIGEKAVYLKSRAGLGTSFITPISHVQLNNCEWSVWSAELVALNQRYWSIVLDL